jgi:NHS family xanthosine MFS transporter
MRLKYRLTLLSFLQFFIWGSWLITIGGYWFQNKGWSGTEFGAIFSTMGIASLFMPALAGVIADRWVNAEKLLGVFHLLGAICLFLVPQMQNPAQMFSLMLVNMMFYMPTISLSITVSYSAMKKANMDIVKEYPPIRVFGTIGFIVAMWTVSLMKIETSSMQFYVASIAAFILGIYSFTLPKCDVNAQVKKKTLIDTLGLKAFTLFKDSKMALFFIFSMLLGAALQLTNAYGDTFLHDFAKIDAYKGLTAIKYPAIIMSISQMSETLFILTIPFFLRKFGIKKVMLFSMIAWVFRFGLFGFGNPADGLWMIILSCIIYGMAFDFFNISGSLYVETQTDSSIRASAQGVFMMMTNGFGAIMGSSLSGLLIDHFFKATNGDFQWQGIWFTFAAYALVVAVLFAIFFKHKHNPNELQNINH